MKDFKNEYQQTPIPAAPTFKVGDVVAYSPNPGQLLRGTVVANASEPRRYIVEFGPGSTRAIDAHNLTLVPQI